MFMKSLTYTAASSIYQLENMKKKSSSTTKQPSKKASPAKLKTVKATKAQDVSFENILRLLQSKFGTDLSLYKPSTIERRISKQMMLNRSPDYKSFEKSLKKDSVALKILHDSIFIHVTHFFRDPDVFKTLKKSVLTPLVTQKKPGDSIRIWVAGCSTGEEAYSLAILLTEVLEAKKQNLKVQIFATDVSESAIKKARKGFFTEDQLKGMEKKRINRFFDKTAEGYKITKDLRDKCIFSKHDLTRNPPFAGLDLVTCRNVLIYFNSILQKQVLTIFHYALRPGGYIWLGPSETLGSVSKAFQQVDKKVKIYQKKLNSRLNLPPNGFDSKNLGTAKEDELAPRTDSFKTADKIILEKYAPPGVVISDDLEILQFRGRTAPYLEQPTGQPTLNLLKMAHRDLVIPLRTLIQQVRKNNTSARKEVSAAFPKATKKLIIEIAPVNPHASETERQYLVLLIQRTAGTQEKAQAGKEKILLDDSTASYIEELLQELETKNEYQRSLVEQYEAAQEELTSSNEELQATNEELQSTNEELETAQEELQASNEELTSMNDELQIRNNEIIKAYESLARGEDRFRMMVNSVKDYAIFMLDPNGRVESWNEGAKRVKGYEAEEILGHHFSQFYPPEALAENKPAKELEIAQNEGRVEDEGWRIRKDGTRFWANTVITRMNNSNNELIGFAKVTRDLTEKKHAEEEIERAEERIRLMVNSVKDYAIFMLDTEGNIASWNEGAKRIKGYEADEVIGSHFSRFYLPEDIARNHPQEELRIATVTGKYEEEGWRLKKDGSTFWANVVITRLDDSTGKHIGFVKVTRDLSERKRAEEQLRQTNESLEIRVQERTKELEDAVKVRDEFLSIASHELKTPLTSLKLQLQLSRKRVNKIEGSPISTEVFNSLENCLRQTNSLSKLIDDLLDVTRIQSGKMPLDLNNVNLSSLLKDVVGRFSDSLENAGCTVNLNLDDKIKGFWDAGRLEQVVVNIVANAIKYAPGKPIDISSKVIDGTAVFSIQDYGCGIKKEDHAEVFGKFTRVNTDKNVGGLGLGLYIVNRIIEAHKGTISLDSEPNKGAKFTISLPV